MVRPHVKRHFKFVKCIQYGQPYSETMLWGPVEEDFRSWYYTMHMPWVRRGRPVSEL